MLACSGYKVPTLHLQNTKLHSSKFGLQVWNDITHMYIYGTTNHKYWFTNLQVHGCNVRILTPLAFHRYRYITSIFGTVPMDRRFSCTFLKVWLQVAADMYSSFLPRVYFYLYNLHYWYKSSLWRDSEPWPWLKLTAPMSKSMKFLIIPPLVLVILAFHVQYHILTWQLWLQYI